ncbi:MAG: hypothetical protein ACYC1A_11410 [Spirochaetales bacterium]
MIFLDTSETLARIEGTLPSGHQLLGLAAELAAGKEADDLAAKTMAIEPLYQRANTPAWLGEFGVLGDPEGPRGKEGASFLLWLGPKTASGFRQLVLSPPPGRYRIEYWDTSDGHLAGVEIGTAAPLVLGPPACAAPFILRVVSLL